MLKLYNMKYKYLLTFSVFIIKSIFAFSNCPLNVYGKDAMNAGIYVYDIELDSTIIEYQSKKVFTPASITKALTSATALTLLPDDFKFETKIFIVGHIKNNVLYGDIVINATGDATIESKHFPSNLGLCDSIVKRLKALHIEKIEGKCRINPTNFNIDCGINPNWEIEDVAWSYGAGLYPFNYKNNTTNLSIKNGNIKTVPYTHDISYTILKNDNNSVDLMRPFYSNDLYIQGNVNNSYSNSISIPFPEDVFFDELSQMLSENNIEINNNSIEGINNYNNTLLYTHYSPSIHEILKSLMIRSDNLFAESMLRAISKGNSLKHAISKELSTWENRGLNTDFITIRDGSGLSRTNRISPLFMGKMLNWMANSKYANAYISYFPKAGIDGTLKNFLKDSRLEGKIVLKTGSMNGVQCYAGYKLDENQNPTHIIVIMINNFFCKRAELKKEIENLLLNTF